MTILDIIGARHFSAHFGRGSAAAHQSVRDFASSALRGVTTIAEGTSLFDDYRDCLLRDAERNLFLSASLYRRALDLMTVGACAWSHVTLYYSAFFASCGFMEMFGGWAAPPNVLVEVVTSAPGSQIAAVRRKQQIKTLTTYVGSHRMFWDLYYKACTPLIPWVPSHLQTAITPVSSDPMWLIDRRNEINYNSFMALDLAVGFQRSFRGSRFPHSLPGSISTQFQITRAAVELSFSIAKDLRLRTDALIGLGSRGRRRGLIRDLVYATRAPSLRRNYMMGKVLV